MAAAALSVAAPLAGLALAGRPLAPYLGLPRAQVVAHAPFSWTAFALMTLPVLFFIALLIVALARANPPPRTSVLHPFPAWGWIGAALAASGWVVLWNKGLGPPAWRTQAFTLLWLGYIVVMNALAFRRSGASPLTQRTGWFVCLFPASAAAWWMFEYLNQFTANWYYAGVEGQSDWEYLLHGMLPFSTVLPAIASTRAWLSSFPRLQTVGLPPVRGHRALAWMALLAGVALLGALGLWPETLYPFLWVAPLLVLGALQPLVGLPSYFAPLAEGDWRPVLQPALAGLVCGFFWELWNSGAMPKWHYSIPFVQRVHLFEMPLLGYAGYLPFGVGCALAMDCLSQVGRRTTRESAK